MFWIFSFKFLVVDVLKKVFAAAVTHFPHGDHYNFILSLVYQLHVCVAFSQCVYWGVSKSGSCCCMMDAKNHQLQMATGWELCLALTPLVFHSSLSIPVSTMSVLPAGTSWRLSTPSSPQSSRTMWSQWSICAATSGPSRAWTTATSSSQQSKTPGCRIWLTVAAGHTAPRLPKVQ